MKRYIRTTDGRVIDLEDKQISSYQYIPFAEATSKNWGLEEACILIYYFDEDLGQYLERDGKGGHSMDGYDESEIEDSSNELTKLLDTYVVVFRDGAIVLFNDLNFAIWEQKAKRKKVEIFGAVWYLNKNKIPKLNCVCKYNEDKKGLDMLYD